MTIGTKNEKMAYQHIASVHTPPRRIGRNMARAFVVGGGICVIGQMVQTLFVRYAHFTPKEAANPTVAVMVLLSVVFTALGVYDRFAQWAGAG
ncbi:MAG: SpoVA/SpoVAEb family sporulation membrane protein, partial [Alicyclobacillaceae bacterium]|nr:SpoVA/SpoVAEb family sporulation membrane protein [Alicyclobacillaceae bacterium]